MSADRIHVTVDGEPVTREVNWNDVRAYLKRSAGWRLVERVMPEGYEWWENPREDGPWRVLLGDDRLWATVMRIAEREQRHPSVALRDIARGTEPSGALNQIQAEALVTVILGKKVGWSHEQVAALVAHLLLDRSLEERPEVLALVDGAKRRAIREAEHLRRCEEAAQAMAARTPHK